MWWTARRELVYPVDYGYLNDTTGSDQAPIDVFRGTQKSNLIQAVVVSADILKKDCEVKLLVGCTQEEEYAILEFLNQTEFQKAILVRRSKDVPDWAVND